MLTICQRWKRVANHPSYYTNFLTEFGKKVVFPHTACVAASDVIGLSPKPITPDPVLSSPNQIPEVQVQPGSVLQTQTHALMAHERETF